LIAQIAEPQRICSCELKNTAQMPLVVSETAICFCKCSRAQYYHHRNNTFYTQRTFHRIRIKISSVHCSTANLRWWLTTVISSSHSLCNKWADNKQQLSHFLSYS